MTTFFRRYVAHDWWLKTFSLVMAVLLWSTVARDLITEIPSLSVPIEIRGMPENLEISSQAVPQAQLSLRGPSRLLRAVRSSDVHVEILMSDPKPGEHTFNLSAHNVRVPRDIQVAQIVPPTLHIAFDWRKTRTVAIKPRVIGSLVSGMKISGVTVEPSQITVTGPQGHVDAVDAATTDPIDATGVLNRSAFTTNAYVADPLVQVVHPQSVRVIITVGKSISN